MAKRVRSTGKARSEKVARSLVDVILGEAAFLATTEQRFRDMQAIASVIINRAQRLHVTPEQVIAAPGQFDAYGTNLPEGSEEFRKLAELALRDVQVAGAVNNAIYYATPERVPHLLDKIPSLQRLTETVAHVYFDDPSNERIKTTLGALKPDPAPDFVPRTQTPMYDAGQMRTMRRGAEHSLIALDPLVGRTAADKRVREERFWSNPAWQSYLFDFAQPQASPPDVVPIPQPRYQTESVPIPMRRPDNLGLDRSSYAPNEAVDPFGTRSIPSTPRGGLLGPVMPPKQDRLGRPRDLPAGVMSRMSAAAGSRTPVGGLMAGSFAYPEPSAAAFNYGLNPSMRMGLMSNTPTGFDQRYGLPDLGTAALRSNPNYRPGAAPAAPIGGSQRASLDARLAGVASAPDLRQSALLSNPTYQPAQRLPGGGTLGQIGPEGLPGEVGPSLAEINRAADAMRSPAAMAAYTQAQQQAVNRERAFNAILGQPRNQPRNEMRFGAPPSKRSIEERAFLANSTPNPGSTFGDMLAGMDRLAAPRFASNFPARPAEIAPNRFARQPQTAAPVAGPAAIATPAETLAGQEQTIAAPTYGKVPSPRRQQRTVAPLGAFPPAPSPPTEFDALRAQFPAALRNATVGALTGGVPGAAIGFVGSLLGPQFAGLGRGRFGPSTNSGQPGLSPYGVGSGLAGMSAAIGGRRGATAFSRSNPGMSYTSLGPNLGGLRRSDRFGWTEVVGPDGAVRGISYDNPKAGGLLGSLSRTVGGLLGGHFPSTGSGRKGHSTSSRRDKGKKSDNGRYSGAGLY